MLVGNNGMAELECVALGIHRGDKLCKFFLLGGMGTGWGRSIMRSTLCRHVTAALTLVLTNYCQLY
jgi:hypothetical protein